MSTQSTAPPIRFATERERKTYQIGMAQVAARLKGHVAPTAAEREAATIAEGRAIIAKRFGRETFKRMFGCEPAKTMAPPAKAAPAAPARKAFAEPASTSTRTRHFYACKNWLPQTA